MKPVQRCFEALLPICGRMKINHQKTWISALDLMPDNPTKQQAIKAMLEAINQHQQ